MPETPAAAVATDLWRPFRIAVAAAAAIIGADALVGPPGRLTREHGGVELASALLYLWAAAVWIGLHGRREALRGWQVPGALLLMSAREFDLDKSLTSVGLLKSRLYLSAEAPAWERLLGLAVIGLILAVVVRLVRHQGRAFLARLRAGGRAEATMLAGLLLAAFAKSIDGIGRKLAGVGLDLGAGTVAAFGGAEEAVELMVPLLFLGAVLLGAHRRRRAGGG